MGWVNTRTTFEKVKASTERYEMVDGKRRLRRKTFWQTVNPFNRNSDGTVKTRAEVYAAVAAEARAWAAEGLSRAKRAGVLPGGGE